jgi:hypothetical protein
MSKFEPAVVTRLRSFRLTFPVFPYAGGYHNNLPFAGEKGFILGGEGSVSQ